MDDWETLADSYNDMINEPSESNNSKIILKKREENIKLGFPIGYPALCGWKLSKKVHRTLYVSKGYILSEGYNKYREIKNKEKKFVSVYKNPTFSKWQKRLPPIFLPSLA